MMRRLALALCVTLVSSADLVAAEPEIFNMGFYLPGIRDANLADVRVSLQVWAEEMGRPFGLLAKAVTYDDMQMLRRDVVSGKVALAVAPGMELADTFAPEEITEGFAGRVAGSGSGLVLAVDKAAGIRNFADLRGKRVVRLANDRLAEIYLDVQCRRQSGLRCSEYFVLSEEKRDQQSIHRVFFGKADAALVSIGALQAARELNPQVAQRLNVLLEWKTAGASFGIMTIHSDPGLRKKVMNSAMHSTDSVRGRQILQIFKTDYMEPIDRDALQPYWQLSREYQGLLQTKPAMKK